MGLTYDQLYPGRFIKAGEFNGRPVTLTITSVTLDTLEKEDGTEREQPIVSFAETKRQWVLIKTNAQCLRAMWGDAVDEWIGKRVTLYPERDTSGLSDSGLCIRVKGSPDLAEPIEATIKLPRRRPVERRLVPTTNGNGKSAKQKSRGAEAAPATLVDQKTGENLGTDDDFDDAASFDGGEPSEAELGETFGEEPEWAREEGAA